MNKSFLRKPVAGLAIGLLTVLLGGCVVAGVSGPGYDDGVSVWPGYYEPGGGYYGGWGPGYRVGPTRGGGYRAGQFGGGAGQHAFGAASHAMPSIPSGGRSGGGGRGRR